MNGLWRSNGRQNLEERTGSIERETPAEFVKPIMSSWEWEGGGAQDGEVQGVAVPGGG